MSGAHKVRRWGLAAVRSVAVLAALAFGVWAADHPLGSDWGTVFVLVPLGVIVGAAANRWWVVAIPAAAMLAALAPGAIRNEFDSAEFGYASILVLAAFFTVAA